VKSLCSILWLFAAQALAAHLSGPPVLVGRASLSAAPDALAQGDSGPINRVAFDLGNLDTGGAVQVSCLYERTFFYRCAATFERPPGAAGSLRAIVEIPDIDRGSHVVVRFTTANGRIEAPVQIVNRPHVTHEIESVLLPKGGRTVTDGNGRAAASMQLASERASTLPAAGVVQHGAAGCGHIYARWVSANATDPVFTSPFGALNGTVVLGKAPDPGLVADSRNGPEWLITYPLGATRVQFIAHYELDYRVSVCAELTAAS
jgi:hypothetical protein